MADFIIKKKLIMDKNEIVKLRLKENISIKEKILSDDKLINQIIKVSEVIISCFKNENKLWLCGNGGSAADAQHLAAEFTGRYYFDRPPLPAEAIQVNTSYITAVANDYSYDEIFSRYIKAHGKKGDVLIGITTSGKSSNVIKALQTAKEIGLETIGFTGNYVDMLLKYTDYIVSVPSSDTPRIQEAHITIGHLICEIVEKELFLK
jgi:D-sedoheptulose 7-phosphate isomerase